MGRSFLNQSLLELGIQRHNQQICNSDEFNKDFFIFNRDLNAILPNASVYNLCQL